MSVSAGSILLCLNVIKWAGSDTKTACMGAFISERRVDDVIKVDRDCERTTLLNSVPRDILVICLSGCVLCRSSGLLLLRGVHVDGVRPP